MKFFDMINLSYSFCFCYVYGITFTKKSLEQRALISIVRTPIDERR